MSDLPALRSERLPALPPPTGRQAPASLRAPSDGLKLSGGTGPGPRAARLARVRPVTGENPPAARPDTWHQPRTPAGPKGQQLPRCDQPLPLPTPCTRPLAAGGGPARQPLEQRKQGGDMPTGARRGLQAGRRRGGMATSPSARSPAPGMLCRGLASFPPRPGPHRRAGPEAAPGRGDVPSGGPGERAQPGRRCPGEGLEDVDFVPADAVQVVVQRQ